MGKIVSIANQKGGVGKTTTSINLSTVLAKRGKKVLLMDADPQGNATSGLGINKEQQFSVYDVLIEDIEVENTLQSTIVKHLDLCPSNINLAGAEVQLVSMEEREYRLKKKIDSIKDKYDFLIIDTPASMNLITINALCAADYLVLPVCCDMFAIDSMKTLLDNLLELKEKHLSKCNLLGILRTIYDPMQPLASRISHELAESFKDLLFATKISYNPKISESSSAACPVLVYDRTSLGSREYLSFAGEILKKLRQLQ